MLPISVQFYVYCTLLCQKNTKNDSRQQTNDSNPMGIRSFE